MSAEKYERMLSQEKLPDEQDIQAVIGAPAYSLWEKLRKFLETAYDFSPETIFGGKKYGWMVRYRKGGKTFCALYPEYGAFTVLIVLGKKEVEGALAVIDDFKSPVKDAIVNTPQFHDGKWLWIRVEQEIMVEDITKLLQIKRKPKKGGMEA